MNEQSSHEQAPHKWYTRPVLFVSDITRALHFYIDVLAFKKSWHEADGAGTVCQVNRAGCEIILCEDAGRKGKARLFVELTRQGVAELQREIAQQSIPNQKFWWGSNVIQVEDPDGNELLFPLPD